MRRSSVLWARCVGVVEPDLGLLELAAFQRGEPFLIILVGFLVAVESLELEVDVGAEDRGDGQRGRPRPWPAGGDCGGPACRSG